MKTIIKLNVRVLLIFMVVSALGACALNKDIPYAEKSIVANISATNDLNYFNRQSHTVALVVYQLSEPNIFNQMLEDPAAIPVLLQGDSFDASVKSRRRVIVRPDENRVLTMDRAADVRYIAVVAGYYNRRSGNFSRLYQAKVWKLIFWSPPRKTKINIKLGRNGLLSE